LSRDIFICRLHFSQSDDQQKPDSEKPKYDGGADQILMPKKHPSEWIKSVRDGKTGKVYIYDKFRKSFPEQVTNKR
jgi:filamentous hemagglutinin